MRLALTLLFSLIAAPALAAILVFAPSSMTDVMTTLAADHEARTGQAVRVSFAATSQLARQLDAGAPADVFITADSEWMDWAVERQAVRADSATVFAGNTLVVVTAKGSKKRWPALLEGDARFAMAEPEGVPAGRYAKAALMSADLWDTVKGNAVFGENVRVTLRLAARGEVGAAIVYESDALSEPAVTIAHRFATNTHAPIRYFAALTPEADGTAAAFIDALAATAAQTTLTEAGFAVPPFAK